jgi:hypothetical protein
MKGNRRRQVLGLTMALAIVVMGLSVASPAFATPTGEYAVFAQCPLSNEALKGCIYAKTEKGEFSVGSEKVPITNPIILQGGFTENEATEALTFQAAANGETLSKSAQKVPGGLSGLVKCNEISNFIERVACELVFENGATGVNAITELAKPATSIGLNEANLLAEEGTALSLPVKVRLENAFLGSECYVGSNSSPIVINLTTGATSPPKGYKSIHGSKGVEEVNSEGTILTLAKNSLVNNTFAAPASNGCGGLFEFAIGYIVNSKLGLPAAEGKNTAILDGTLKQAGARRVREH